MIDFDMKSVSGRKGKQEGGIKKIAKGIFLQIAQSKGKKRGVQLKLPLKPVQKQE